ncbi:MAG: hypothetical protein ACJASJ_001274 [Candidatus Azotimanducaceae bacterium]|jgi:hypothetical protein
MLGIKAFAVQVNLDFIVKLGETGARSRGDDGA